ncbi:MAG: sodium/proline symporter PutP [Marinilabiliales bacterium]
MIIIGFYFYNKTGDVNDYYLGGRSLNKWVVSISAQASDMSGWLLMGLPGLAYLSGLNALWMAIGLIIGTYLNWTLIAKRLRLYTEIAGNSITIPDFFENRFNDTTHLLRVISALFILVFFTIYTASGFVAGAKLFEEILPVSYKIALMVGAFIIISYTFLGGFFAVAWTDLIQGLLMFFAIIAMPVFVIYKSGYNITNLNDAGLLNIITAKDGSNLSLIVVFSMLGWGLGYMGQPHILTRFMSIKSARKIKDSKIIAMVWVIVCLLLVVFMGLIGNTAITGKLEDSEKVLITLSQMYYPPVVTGIFLSAVLAAIMSTADSQLLVASSAFTKDLYNLFNKKITEKRLVNISRLAVIIIAVAAFLIALDPENSVLRLVEFAWAGFGSTFGPVVVFALYWKRMTRLGAFAGIIAGGATVIIWNCFEGGIFELYEMIPGVFISSIFLIIISVLDKSPYQKITGSFDYIRQKLKQL